MGLISEILGIGKAAKEVAEVFVPNRTQAQMFEHEEQRAALRQYSQEYRLVQQGWFNQLVNGLNRLPRPIMALGTVGLFVFAMVEPVGFSRRMVGLDAIPYELWWLLGAVVSFYFGARELHHQRENKRPSALLQSVETAPQRDDNAAVADWLSQG